MLLRLLVTTTLRALLWWPAATVVDDDVDAAFGILLERLVVVAWLGELGDYVPGVDEARKLGGTGC